ncbi:MAG: NUDIX domain-containing protein [Bacteroidia bacterium]|jgi:8-oxo-dGTP diphosphatase
MRKFNVRIYGLLLQGTNVLITDELIAGRQITKFPGGGLEFGESTIDCIKREFIEEMNLEIEVLSHFYTTDFFVPSAFDDSQVISIYYRVKPANVELNDVSIFNNEQQSFKWLPLNIINADDFTFPIDKRVAEMLRNKDNL